MPKTAGFNIASALSIKPGKCEFDCGQIWDRGDVFVWFWGVLVLVAVVALSVWLQRRR